MRRKIYNVLKNIYGICMTVSFFAGFLPLIPFIIAIIIGGESAEAISLFLHKQYYPWVIALASVAVIIGLIAMYIGKLEGLSVKKISASDKIEPHGDSTTEASAEADSEEDPEANN